MRFRFIRDHRERWRVAEMCSALEVSRSGFYAWLTRPPSAHQQANEKLVVAIREIHETSWQIYGSPRVHAELRAQGQAVNAKRVARLMRLHGIRSKVRRRFRRTTQSDHRHPIAPNVLDRRFEVAEPNVAWAGDITYIRTREGWLFLAALMDLGSRAIVGWAMRDRMTQELALDALRMALGRRRPASGVVLHSDRGSQYAAEAYRRLAETHSDEQVEQLASRFDRLESFLVRRAGVLDVRRGRFGNAGEAQ